MLQTPASSFFQELWSPPVHWVLFSNQDLNYIADIHGIRTGYMGGAIVCTFLRQIRD